LIKRFDQEDSVAFYTFYLPQNLPPGAVQAEEKLRVVKDGFSWLAFVFPLPWLLLNRLWLWSALYFAASLLLGLAAAMLGANDSVLMPSMIMLSCFIGLEAGTLKAEGLRKRGYAPAASFVAGSREEAELKFFAAIDG
jgi:hypothetical protein